MCCDLTPGGAQMQMNPMMMNNPMMMGNPGMGGMPPGMMGGGMKKSD